MAGDSTIIGSPSVNIGHVSQVDLSTTILSITSGNKQWIGFGKNILDNMDSKYTVTMRPAGIRLDYEGYGFIVDRYNLNSTLCSQHFHILLI